MVELLNKIKNLFFPAQGEKTSAGTGAGVQAATGEESEAVFDEVTTEEKAVAG